MDEREKNRPNPVRIILEKASSYRSLHSDGVIVTPNANGSVVLSVYSERLRFPSELEMIQGDDGEISEHVVGDHRGLFREISASVYISVDKIDELISELERAKGFVDTVLVEQAEGLGSDE